MSSSWPLAAGVELIIKIAKINLLVKHLNNFTLNYGKNVSLFYLGSSLGWDGCPNMALSHRSFQSVDTNQFTNSCQSWQ
jgi:hypothetical protein